MYHVTKSSIYALLTSRIYSVILWTFVIVAVTLLYLNYTYTGVTWTEKISGEKASLQKEQMNGTERFWSTFMCLGLGIRITLQIYVCLLIEGWASALSEEQPQQSSAGSTDLCTACYMYAGRIQGQFCFVHVVLYCQCMDIMHFSACGYIWFSWMMSVFSIMW